MKSFFTILNNQIILKALALINILWGLSVPFMSHILNAFFGGEALLYTQMLQCVGIIFGALGVGYFIASENPAKHWPIIFVGFLVNILLSLNFLYSLIFNDTHAFMALSLLINVGIWPVPLYYILLSAYEENTLEESSPKRFHDLIKFARTNQGPSLLDLSDKNKVLLVFIRHFGCTFCRETVSEIAKLEKVIEGKKLTLVYVHMSDPSFGDEFFSKYYNHPIYHVADPTRTLYKSLGLKRGNLYQLFGPMTWIRGVWAGVFKGHGIGGFEGDTLQLGGVFVLSQGQIIFEKKASCASELFNLNLLLEL